MEVQPGQAELSGDVSRHEGGGGERASPQKQYAGAPGSRKAAPDVPERSCVDRGYVGGIPKCCADFAAAGHSDQR